MVFLPQKINYHAQNVEIWRCTAGCHDLTFCVQRVIRRCKSAFVGKCKQNQCYNELLNAYMYQPSMTCRIDHIHMDKYQISLCLYFETQFTLFCALFHSEFEH